MIWATAYLDEAERCDTVILLNEGQVEFHGRPAALTSALAQRQPLFKRTPSEDRRWVLSASVEPVLRLRWGDSGRFSPGRASQRRQPREEITALAQTAGAQLIAVPPRFEDGFIDLLGGGPSGTSALAERMAHVGIASGQRGRVPRSDPPLWPICSDGSSEFHRPAGRNLRLAGT